MKKTNLLVSLLSLTLFFTLSCKGPEGDPGPEGKQGVPGENYDPNKYYGQKDGFVKDTVKGKWLDGSPFSYVFNFTGSEASENYYKVESNTSTTINIEKRHIGTDTSTLSGFIWLQFKVESMTNLTNPAVEVIFFSLTKNLGKNFIHKIDREVDGSNSNNVNIKDLNYNASTGVLTGKFSLITDPSGDHGPVNITDAPFLTTLSRSVSRIGEE